MRTLKLTDFLLVLLVFFDIGKSFSQTEDIINSPPPSLGFVQTKSALADPSDLVVLQVPAYLWSYGCANTSAAMLIAYYDQNCYNNLYTGSKNGGIAPFSNSPFWPAANDIPGGMNYSNSISASKNGFDNRVTNGHVDDFWECYLCAGSDPNPSWPPHTFSIQPCVADYMGTSQDYWNNLDGSTSVFTDNQTNTKVSNYTLCESQTPRKKDGIQGLREYIEQCGYVVIESFNQNIYGYGGVNAGFTFNDFKAEIDAKRPVLVNFKGHTVIGIGYSTSTNKIRVYTTWSETPWDLVWGTNLTASGQNLAMKSVSVIKLQGTIHKKSESIKYFV